METKVRTSFHEDLCTLCIATPSFVRPSNTHTNTHKFQVPDLKVTLVKKTPSLFKGSHPKMTKADNNTLKSLKFYETAFDTLSQLDSKLMT